jgi:glycosyltransferase involved in cell wall biosynthesis
VTQLDAVVPGAPSAPARLRVVMVVSAAPETGGLEASFARIVAELRAAGVDPSALVIGAAAEHSANYEFLAAIMPTIAADGWHSLGAALADADVVHVHGATSTAWPVRALLAARRHGVPVVVTLHLPSHPVPRRRLRGKVRIGAELILRGALLRLLASAVCAPSAAAAAVARRRFRPWLLDVRPLWNGVVDHGPRPFAAGGPLRLVFVGRLSDHKRPTEFVAAVTAALSAGADVTATLVGDGPLRGEVERAVAASPYADRFRLVGQLDDPTAELQAADLLVLTSQTEGCPLVAMEAACAGRGVVARASIEGLAEGWPGAFVAVDDDGGAPAFAAALTQLAGDRARVRDLGATARRHFEARFSAQRAAAALRATYDGARR